MWRKRKKDERNECYDLIGSMHMPHHFERFYRKFFGTIPFLNNIIVPT